MSPRPALLVISLLALLMGAAFGLGRPRFRIESPHLGAPAIVGSGEQVRIDVATSLPFWRPDFTVGIEGRSGGEALEIVEVERSPLANHVSMVAVLPDEIPEGGLDLWVDSGGSREVRPRAIHVIEHFPSRARFVQLADLPTLGDNGPGDATMQAIVDELNLIAPDAVLFTGDLVYDEGSYRYDVLLGYLKQLDAPAIVALGNHEYNGWASILRLLVETRSAVDFGAYRLISLNSGHGRDQFTRSQLRWLGRTLDEREGKTALLQVHHPLFGGRGVARGGEEVLDEIAEHRVPLVLSGHMHRDAMFDAEGARRRDRWDFPGPKLAVTTTAGKDLRPGPPGDPEPYHGYRLIRLAGDDLLSLTYDSDGDGVRDAASSYPFGRVTAEYPEAGSAVIHNDLNEPLERARVRIPSPGGGAQLAPDRGCLIEVQGDGAGAAYLVELDLPANSSTAVRLEETRGS